MKRLADFRVVATHGVRKAGAFRWALTQSTLILVAKLRVVLQTAPKS